MDVASNGVGAVELDVANNLERALPIFANGFELKTIEED